MSNQNQSRKLFDSLIRITLEFIKGKSFQPQSKEDFIDRLKIHEAHVETFDQVLHSLKESGHVFIDNERYHRKPLEKPSEPVVEASSFKRVQGALSVHPRGFGFVNMPSPQEDIFIPKPMMNGAVDGDFVEVEYDPSNYSEKGPDGRVVAILERGRKEIVGTVMSRDDSSAFVYSSLLGETNLCPCPITDKHSKIKKGDRVILEVLAWGAKKQPESCRIREIIGNIDDPMSDIPFAIAAHQIRDAFSQKVLAEAKRCGSRVPAAEIERRRDLRDLECFTVDPDTAKDFDDAVSLEKIGSRYRLGVHIADVSHYVTAGSHLDTEAALRCNSTYFPGKCVPMIPHDLSDNLCSLKPNVNRLTVSVFIDIDESGKTVGSEIVRAVIRSQKRFTYKEAKLVLEGKRKSKHSPTMHLMVELCNVLQHDRAVRGSVQLSMPELVLKVNDQGLPTGTEIHEYDITHQMIEEFMLKANETVAIHLHRQGKDITYRVHEEPAQESLREFALLVASFGFTLPETPTAHDIQRFFCELEKSAHPNAQYLAICYIKSMRQACYSVDNIGHYGLSLEHYCHFTSPIRRYVDTISHRLLFSDPIQKDIVEQICLRASDRERVSARAETSVIQLKKLRYLSHLKAAAPESQYNAIVSRIKPYGIYFDVVEIMMDGFLHISELEDDYFLFDDTRSILTGRHHGSMYKAGDTIVVMPKAIDLITCEASWFMVGKSNSEGEQTVQPERKKTSRDKHRKSRLLP